MHPTTTVAMPRGRRSGVAALICLALALSCTVVASRPASAAGMTASQLATRFMNSVNYLRGKHGLPALKYTTKLSTSALGHSRTMARYNKVSLRLPGEPTVTMREFKAGFNVKYAGEIAGVAVTQDSLRTLPARMLTGTERRKVMLSKTFDYAGVAVHYDSARHKYWVTMDFGRPKPPPDPSVAIANSVLTLMNTQRALHGRPALRTNSLLVRSAHAHNLWMARYNTMSHQLPGEAFFATRILTTGYDYVTAGENIGWNSVRTLTGVLDLQNIMYNEVPPEDGHRQNILNANFRDVGIDVYFDTHNNKVWLTQDFGALG